MNSLSLDALIYDFVLRQSKNRWPYGSLIIFVLHNGFKIIELVLLLIIELKVNEDSLIFVILKLLK
ncbi:hypothetical protein DDB_G0282043 [Dictyostelium discoideum AX4]|uniref:hypothetical protein n=1 Tax=Dictyostelium discoideum AX4 TaxID=352472 RepID=UPI00004E4DAF|nr:hypothetical protein DDB_G0282043 [Dictyostelium discoideum AX4]EAL66443.1 hypothetical protein DDB_G0282043 [Dictyostelium discoideum AX4]|eukprot:XP_640432.1 hypothetical protein DDB_G0282043 [Dictyostelium discoideum AX4]